MGPGGGGIVTAKGTAMAITVLVSPSPSGRGFKARVGEPHALAVEAKDRETAFAGLVELMRCRAPGAEFTRIDAPVYHPMLDAFGTIDADIPATKEWENAVQEYRRLRDSEDGVPVEAGDPA
jgi:hypothetical protein